MKYLILLIVSASALSNLPDEINYYPYEQNYNQISNDLDDANTLLDSQKEQLVQTLRSISYTENSINELQNQIDNDRQELQRLQSLLPRLVQDRRGLQSEMANIGQKIQNQSRKVKNLQSQINNEKKSLRPITQRFNRQSELIKKIQNNIESKRRDIGLMDKGIQKAVAQAKYLRGLNANLKKSIERFKSEKVTKSNEVKTLKANVQEFNQTERKLKSLLETLAKRSVKLNQKLAIAKKQLDKLISNAASKELIIAKRKEISDLNNKLRVVTANKKQTNIEISSINMRRNKTKQSISKLETYIQSLPGLIRDNKARLDKNRGLIAAELKIKERIEGTKAKASKEIEVFKSNKSIEITKLDRIKKKLVAREAVLQDLRQSRNTVAQRLNRNQNQYDRADQALRNLDIQISNTRADIPSISNNIDTNSSSLNLANDDLANQRSNEQIQRVEISQSQSRVLTLEDQKSIAYSDYSNRKNLYINYNQKAQSLGDSQTSAAIKIGQDTGARLANSLSSKNAASLSNEIGEVKAKLIGNTRGEIQGYAIGYDEGINSNASMNEGTRQGESDATVNSYQYAQIVLKPQFFEEYYQAALRESVMQVETKEFNFNKSFALFEEFSSVMPLAQNEIDQSNKLKTSLDTKIEGLRQSEDDLESKLQNFKLAEFAYVAPTNVPYQSVDCSGVYKGLKVFVDSCNESYRLSFSNKFYGSSKANFSNLYPSLFSQLYSSKLQSIIDNKYQASYNSAQAVAFSEAKVVGKKDAYDRSYEDSYNLNYSRLLPIESDKAKLEAKVESSNWIYNNAAVTVKSIRFDNQMLKGSDKANIVIELKNISNIKAFNPGSIKFESINNIVLSKESFMLPDVDGRSSVTMMIPFSVANTASSNDFISFNAKVLLPKDKYKQTRTEDHSLNQKLIKNPKFSLVLDYNRTPKVKGFRSYYVHALDFKVTPVVESIYKGYTVTLEPQGNAANYLRIKNNNTRTGSTNLNIENKTSIKYVFNKSAKNRKLSFKAIVKYEGIELSSQIIEITPR